MNKKTYKRQRDLKTKLMAAVCMLLVSSLMMITSTYAWFTLSTAPEVTGITTAVGANGNLEMALMPESGNITDIKSDVGDSNKLPKEKNTTWGNLVDLKNGYGLDQIALNPSALNVLTKDAAENPTSIAMQGILQTPVYGADGRIDKLESNTDTSTYDNGFPINGASGVRAIGTASGMTDRQLAYRNARTYALSAMAQAKDNAANSLTTNGNALANIAIKHGSDGDATHTQEEVASLIAIVDDLLGDNTVSTTTPEEGGEAVTTVVTTSEVDGILEYIEEAYRQYILAYGASKSAAGQGLDDTKFMVFKSVVENAETLDDVLAALTENAVTLPETITGYINSLKETKAKVIEARLKLAALEGTGDAISWDKIRDAMAPLADPDQLKVNDIPAGQIMEKVNDLLNSYTANGLYVTIGTGGGIYADVADHCGDYDASILIAKVSYGTTINLENVKARMETKTTVNPVYLTLVSAAVDGAGQPEGGDGSMPLTDMYGYILDLAFQTNATDSNLLLQQEGIDRIYDENGNEQTMGNGSSMTFKATTNDFSDEQVLALMRAIRIVFVTPGTESYDVVATAKLDTTHYTKGADGITAMMYLYRLTAGGEIVYDTATWEDGKPEGTYYTKTMEYEYTEADVTTDTFGAMVAAKLYTKSGDTYEEVSTEATYDEATDYYTRSVEQVAVYTPISAAPGEGVQVYTKKTTTAGETVMDDNVIMALPQNTPTQLSVLVYLDGAYITNGAVASTASTSVSGTMNLQFASSANLVPMEYADLHLPVTENKLTGISVSGDSSVSASGSYNATGNVTIALTGMTDAHTISSVSVAGATLATSDYQYQDGTLTFTKADIKASDAIVITVAAPVPETTVAVEGA